MTGKPIATATEQAQAMEACIHRWAIRLARAPGPNREIADAVLAGCAEPITLTPHMYRQEKNDDLADEAYWTSRATKLALFHVVQARAGDCPLPNE
ncbi:MAG TPA: hypothetical protein VD768_08745 [Sphingomicrobium sp.]|nr:hypothetical protein [Sphingomicrobium sp.]